MDTEVVPATGVVNDGALLQWASNVGLGRKVEQLIAARRELSSVLAEAQGKAIQNQALLLHLREAWNRACSAKDLLCELDYYRIHGEMEQPDDKLLHGIGDQNFLLSAPGSDIKFSNNDIAETAEDASTDKKVPVRNEGSAPPTAEITPYITNTMVVANTAGPVSHYEILGKDISREISEQVEECCRITAHVRKALELENLDYRIMQIHNSTMSDYRESSPNHSEHKVHGRDQERDFIISKLTNEESTTKKISVIAITGHGGVGKTTLARLVFNNSIVSKHFDILLWVYVSVHFDQVKIMHELLDTLCGDSHEKITKSDELQEKLEYMLKLKRVLLVMDDMWEDSKKETWDGLINALLTNDVYGNKVLVTTRKPSVATMIGASDRINLDGLNKGDFWRLFKECAFGDENYKGEKKLEKIGQRIVERLKGNPLAAKTLGKVLRRKFDVDYWRRILDTSEWKYRSDEDDIMPALMISYKYLPHHLQRCFSYCAVFPKYHRYDQESLVHMWIAQDFVYSLDVHRRPEDIGIEYLNGLVDGGFLEKQSELSSLLIMHDLIHDLAQKVSLDESFTIENSDPRDIPLLVRHVSVITEREYKTETDGVVHPNEQFLEEFSNSVIKLRRRSLSTLMLFGPHDSDFANTFRQEISEVKSVRVLKLEMVFFELDALIDNISAFINLRHLELGCFYKGPRLELPEAICRLYHLQVLDVIKNWGVGTVLPRGMNKLVNLRHFIAEKELHTQIASIGKMVALQELKAFDVREESEFSISQLKRLNQLRGSISISSLYHVRREEAAEARLCDKVYLTSLELSWYTLSGARSGKRSAPILENLELPSCLRNLRIVAYRHDIPSWLSSNVHLTSLRSIYLVNCLRWESIPHPNQLPLLQEMHLINLPCVRNIEIGPLKTLELRRLQNLRQCILSEKEQSYATLRILEVESCPRLNTFLSDIFVSSGTQQFSCLHRLQIHNDFILHKIPLLLFTVINSLVDIDLSEPSNFGGLRFRLKPSAKSNGLIAQIEGNKEEINKHNHKLDEIIFTLDKLQDLRELEIHKCSVMAHQHLSSKGFQQLTSLKKFRMIECPAIVSSNLDAFLPPSVEELEFSRCNMSGNQLSQLLLNLHALKNLKIEDCGKVTSLPVGLFTDELNETEEGSWHIPPNCWTYMKSLQICFKRGRNDVSSMMQFSSKQGLGRYVLLENIVIENCLNPLFIIHSGGSSHLSPSSLVKLSISNVQDNTLNLSQVSSIVDLQVSECPYLTCLNLNYCRRLDKLCVTDCSSLQTLQSLQSCMALRDLRVHNCASLCSLQASLSSLKTLTVETNKSLACLELHSCTALEKLYIEDCPSLESWNGLNYLISIKSLRVKSSSGFTRSWVASAAEFRSDHKFSLPLQQFHTDDLGVLSVPICSQLTCLKSLLIDGDHDAGHGYVDIFSDNHEKGLLLLTSLRHLALEKFEHLQSLPAALRSLTSLKRLNIGNCGRITSLPVEGLPDSLKDLEIFNCTKELNSVCRAMVRAKKINLCIDGTDENDFLNDGTDEND